MDTQNRIKAYIASQPDSKRADFEALHQRIIRLLPKSKLWFFDGKDETGKVVSNPQIGYGSQTIKYADGKTKVMFQIGISANTAGISVYVLGLDDKTYLPQKYGKTIGRATVTGYCIKFKALKDIDVNVLEEAIKDVIGKIS